MSNKKNLTKLTNDRLKSPKLLLTVSAALSALVNVITLVALLIGGVDFRYFIVPLALTVLDGAFLAAVLVSNFRFKHAQRLPVYYTVLTLAGALWTFLANGIVEDTVTYTKLSAYTWLVLHGVCCIAVLCSAWKAAKCGKEGKRFSEGATLTFALLLLATGVCGYFSFTDGVFGQGSLLTTRSLEFVYDEEEGFYRAVGVVKGRGNTVVIPAEFNGEKVGAVDCAALDDKSIKTVRFEDATVELEQPRLLVTDRTAKREIYVDKAECDTFRERFFQWAYETSEEEYLRVANAVRPDGLADNEIYATFTYDLNGLKAAKGKTLDTWYGQKGESIDFSKISADAEYVEKSDPNNSEHLYWSYDNLGKKMYKGVATDGELTDGAPLNDSLNNFTVVFEPLYEVNVAADNDDRYELADSFRFGEYNGRQRSRIVTKATADEWLGSVASRDGFTLAWKYGDEKTPFTSLAAVVSDDLTVYPEWTMRAPIIEAVATDKQNGAIYGDTVAFSATVSAPAPSLSLRYEWTKLGDAVSNERDWDFSNVYPEDSGEYTLTVTAYSNTLTTLTSEASDSVEITVGKKSLGFTWTLPSDLVYSATDKTVLAAHNASDVINGDSITFDLSLSKVRDIGNYSSTVSLTGACADLYFVKPADQTVGFTVAPYEISVNWADTALTYNGGMQKPTASVTGLGADGALPLTVTGEQKNAGEDYTASVTTSNGNYKIANSTQTFAIAKATVEMVWTKTSLTYNGYAQKPEASAAGLGSDGELVAIVSGEKKDVGENYTATAKLNASHAKNYLISETTATQAFTIAKSPLTVTWEANTLSLVYNAAGQLPTATATGVGNDGAITIQVSLSEGDGKNVGSHQATATTENGNYEIENPTQAFAITQKQVNANWTDLTFTYDGVAHKPTASVTGEDGDGALGVTVSGEQTNAGEYTATAALTDEWTANYVLNTATASKAFTVAKKAVKLVWQEETTFVYDGEAKTVEVTAVEGLISSDPHDEILGGVTYVAAAETKTVGEYSRTAKLPDEGNYFIETGETQPYAIEQRAISFTWATDRTFTYGDDLTGKVLVESIVDGIGSSAEDAEIIAGLKYAAMEKNAGAYVRTAALSNSGVSANYKLSETEQGCGYTIEKAKLTLDWGTDSFIYKGVEQYATVESVGGVIGNDEVTFTYSVTDSRNAGSYTQTATTENGNYEIENPTQAFAITQKQVNANWTDLTFTYDGKAHKPTASVTGEGDDGALDVTVSGEQTNAGEYTATAALTDEWTANYVLNMATASKAFTVAKKAVTLVWQDKTTFAYDGEAKTVEVTAVEGLISSDPHDEILGGVTYVAAAETKTVGEYSRTAKLPDEGNYFIETGATKEYNIVRREISFTWATDRTFTYGADLTGKVLVESIVGGIGSSAEDAEIIAGLTYAAMEKNAGTYVRTAALSNSGVSANYKLSETEQGCGYTIEKAKLTLVWGTDSFIYKGVEQYATVDGVTGVVGNEKVTFTYSVTDSRNAGSYTQTASTQNGNYKIGNPTQTFTINKAEISLDWSACKNELVYNGEAQTVEAKVTGAIGNETAATFAYYKKVNGESVLWSGKFTVGEYTVKAVPTGNYALETGATAEYSFTVVPKTVTLAVEGETEFEYDGSAKTPVVSLKDGGATLAVKVKLAYYPKDNVSEASKLDGAPTNVGEYVMTVESEDENYVLTDAGRTVSFKIVSAQSKAPETDDEPQA